MFKVHSFSPVNRKWYLRGLAFVLLSVNEVNYFTEESSRLLLGTILGSCWQKCMVYNS